MDKPYQNSQCNLGRALQGMVGGELYHESQTNRFNEDRGDRYIVKGIEEHLSPEAIEANVSTFLSRAGFSLDEEQPEKPFVERGSIRKYIHSQTPNRKYVVTVSVPKSRPEVTVDIGIFYTA